MAGAPAPRLNARKSVETPRLPPHPLRNASCGAREPRSAETARSGQGDEALRRHVGNPGGAVGAPIAQPRPPGPSGGIIGRAWRSAHIRPAETMEDRRPGLSPMREIEAHSGIHARPSVWGDGFGASVAVERRLDAPRKQDLCIHARRRPEGVGSGCRVWTVAPPRQPHGETPPAAANATPPGSRPPCAEAKRPAFRSPGVAAA